jgi:hypothetical protein
MSLIHSLAAFTALFKMYDFAPASWQDWLSIGLFGILLLIIVYRIVRTPPA